MLDRALIRAIPSAKSTRAVRHRVEVSREPTETYSIDVFLDLRKGGEVALKQGLVRGISAILMRIPVVQQEQIMLWGLRAGFAIGSALSSLRNTSNALALNPPSKKPVVTDSDEVRR